MNTFNPSTGGVPTTGAETVGPRQARRSCLLALVAGAAALAVPGCAAWRQVTVDVATYGQWPAGRALGTFAFDRLPSQQAAADPAAREALESAALFALERVGWRPAASAAVADVLVQVGWNEGREFNPWDADRWPGPWGRIGVGVGVGVTGGRWGGGIGWGWPADLPRDVHELTVLLLQRSDRSVLKELRARHVGHLSASQALPVMLDAALQDFENAPTGTRRVVVPLP